MSVGDENSVATFRVVVLGAARAGKTSIIRRFLYDEFSERYHETIEDIHRMNFIVKGYPITLDCLDTNASFAEMRRLAIASANAFIIVFAVDNVQSFKEMSELWTEIAKQRADFRSIPSIIAGAKGDVEAKKIYEATANAWTTRLNASVRYVETSAKKNANVAAIFSYLLELSRFPDAFDLPSPVDTHQCRRSQWRSSSSRSRSSSQKDKNRGMPAIAAAIQQTHKQQHRDSSTDRRKFSDEPMSELISASLPLPFERLSLLRRNHSMRVPRKLPPPPSPTALICGERKPAAKDDQEARDGGVATIRRSNHLSLRLGNKAASGGEHAAGETLGGGANQASDCRIS